MRPSDFQPYQGRILTRDDDLELLEWIVEVQYVNWAGKERFRRIQMTHTVQNERGALTAAIGHLIRRGQVPPKILDMKARQVKDIPERREPILAARRQKAPKSIELVERFLHEQGKSL